MSEETKDDVPTEASKAMDRIIQFGDYLKAIGDPAPSNGKTVEEEAAKEHGAEELPVKEGFQGEAIREVVKDETTTPAKYVKVPKELVSHLDVVDPRRLYQRITCPDGSVLLKEEQTRGIPRSVILSPPEFRGVIVNDWGEEMKAPVRNVLASATCDTLTEGNAEMSETSAIEYRKELIENIVDQIPSDSRVNVEIIRSAVAEILTTITEPLQTSGTKRLICFEGLKLVLKLLEKNQDYGDSAFKSPILCPEISAGTAIKVRMSDKFERILSLSNKAARVVEESVGDTLDDIAGYRILQRTLSEIEGLEDLPI